MAVVLVGVLAYQVTRTALSLRAAESAAEQLQQRLGDGDVEGASESARALAVDADVARRHSDGWLWRGATRLPWLGDDAAAVRAMSAALDRLGAVAPAGIDVLSRVRGEGLRRPDGGVDLTLVEELAAPLDDLSRAARSASETVADVDPDTLLGPLAGRAETFLERVETLRAGSEGGATAARLLPDLLGGDGERQHLLVVQNNAEIRGTGGLPGSLAVLRARDGLASLGFQGSSADFQGDSGAAGELQPGEEETFGRLLVDDVRDAGFSPDFPRAAELWLRHAESARGGTFDGVVALDPVTLAQVLRATGPIEAAGERLDAENAVRQLLHEPYLRFSDEDRTDTFFREAARGVLDALLAAEGDQVELVRVLGEAAAQRRLQFWSAEEDVQRQLVGSAVAGALPQDTGRPEVGLYLDDATRAKMQYFLRHGAEVRSLGCEDDRQRLLVTWTLTSTAPDDAAELPTYLTGGGDFVPEGEQRLQLRMFLPQGGELRGLELDGAPTSVAAGEVYGRGVVQKSVDLRPGQTVEVVMEVVGAPGETGDPRVQWTPGIEWGPTQQVVDSRC